MKLLKFLLLSSFLVLFTTAAYALPSTSFFNTDGSLNYVQDDSVEWLLNRTEDLQGVVTWTDSTVDSILGIGDRLRGVLSFNNVNGTPTGAGTANADLSGIFDLTVFSADSYVNGLGATRYTYIFVPTLSVFSDFSADNIAIEVYDDPAQDFSLYPFTGISRATLELLATNAGGPVMEIGWGAANDFWVADSSTNDVSAFAGGGPSGVGGLGNFGLSVISNTLGLTFLDTLGVDGNMHDIVGNTSLLDPLSSTGDLLDDTDIFFRAVPEPTTMALLGFGLLSLAGIARRKQS